MVRTGQHPPEHPSVRSVANRWPVIVSLLGVVLASLAISASGASAALYTVTDLGASEKEPFEGVAVSLSASGNQVATPCALWNDGALSVYPQGLCGGTGPFNAVNTSGELVGPENSVVEAFRFSFSEAKREFFLKAPLAAEHPNVVNPVSAAYSIDDQGEIGGFVSSNPEKGARTDYSFIFDPSEPSGKQVRLIENTLEVVGLWPGWAEVEAYFKPFEGTRLAVLNRTSGVMQETNLVAGVQWATSAAGSSIASDGTLAGNLVTPGEPATIVPTLRYANGTELSLETPVASIGTAEDVNESHYSVGNVQPTFQTPEAALWTPTGHLELLKELTPSGSGWVLENAIAIANDGVILGTGKLNGVTHSFLLSVGSSLPTATSVACSPPTLAAGKPTSCTFTVADETPGATQTPGGTVSATNSQAGTWSPASVCTLTATATPGRAACSLTYTPAQVGVPTLTGAYSGDGTHGASHGSTSITASSPVSIGPGPGGGGGPGGSGAGGGGSAGAGHAVVNGTGARVLVSCKGAAGTSCTINLTLSILETLAGHQVVAVAAAAQGRHTKRTVIVGSRTVTLAAGRSETVTVSLNAAGRKLLAGRRRLPVKLLASQGHTARAGFTLLFRAPGKHH